MYAFLQDARHHVLSSQLSKLMGLAFARNAGSSKCLWCARICQQLITGEYSIFASNAGSAESVDHVCICSV